MNATELRRKYIEFFESKGHLRHDSAPLVPIDVTGKLDETLLFTGAGMVQFKPYFRGIAKPPHRRLVDSQKCVRAVDIEEVGNPSHLTFFEMLGNFSFGDYFKKEAIAFAWEFLFAKEWLALEPAKICVTIFEQDDETFDIWAPLWKGEGFEPAKKIFRLGEDKNFWPAGSLSKGPPGPCGPCSEIFYQTVPDSEMTGDYLADEAAGRWLEIWNLVFLEYEWRGHLREPERPHLGYQKDAMDLLPQKNIDTGMGLDRTAAVLGNFSSVYETDVFAPIMRAIEGLSGNAPQGERELNAKRVIADHIRTASFCIADGILPANHGRGYVLRRLIRRAVLKGRRVLGIEQPFLNDIYAAVIVALADPYMELRERKEVIVSTLRQEEELFRRTMAEGYSRFEQMLSESGNISGADAFFLYDTFGFPLEVTEELALEHGLTIDLEEYAQCMAEAQNRSRSAQGAGDVFGSREEMVLAAVEGAPLQTEFVGYGAMVADANVVQISPRFDESGLTTGDFQISLDKTPFYAESGGQVGDTGIIACDDFTFDVTNTWKELGQIWHDVKDRSSSRRGLTRDEISSVLQSGYYFKPVRAIVDRSRRNAIMRNHTATHLLHAALREVLGKHVTQAGSLVAPDRLRFDFTHGKGMTQQEIAQVEEIVNKYIAAAHAVHVHEDIPLSEARERGAMMLFGEKYGELVRVIEIPEFEVGAGAFSLELCGGTHVNNTAEIGLFKITGESSSASGVRRIEAVTGYGGYEYVRARDNLLSETAKLLKASIPDIPKAIEKLQTRAREKPRAVETGELGIEPVAVGGVNLYKHALENGNVDEGKLLADRLVENDPKGVSLIAVSGNGRITFLCKANREAVEKGAHAGNLAKEVAKVTGGGGGGSAAFAQAGGKEASKVNDAMKAAAGFLASILAKK